MRSVNRLALAILLFATFLHAQAPKAKPGDAVHCNVSTFWMPDGKIEQYIVTGRD